MAEARMAVRHMTAVNHVGFEVDTSVKKAQVSMNRSGVVIYVPAPYYIWKGMRRSFWRSVDKVQFAFYPVPLSLVTAVALAVFTWVHRTPAGSWPRTSKFADLLWRLDEINPIARRTPSEYRLPLLMTNFAVGGVVVFTMAQRFVLRQLLKYKGWLYERGKPSRTTLVWCFFMRVLLMNRLNKTEAYQSCLPAQPLPPINDTVSRFLKSVEPLLKDKPEEWENMKVLAEKFCNEEGPSIQRYLNLKYYVAENYMTDWWLKYVYLSARESLCINSNWFGVMFASYSPTKHQTSRAAMGIHVLMQVKKKIDKGALEPQFGGVVPLCMDQYTHVFGTTRIPGREQDVLVQYDDTRHIIVLFKGRIYSMSVLHPKTNKVLTPLQLEAALDSIVSSKDETDPGEAMIPCLTTAPRQVWSDIRDQYFVHNPYNAKSLSTIEKAQFVVCLDDETPATLEDEGKAFLCGNGFNRWSDKSFNYVALPNGRNGIHVEHSWGDALTMAEVVEYCTCYDETHELYDSEGRMKPLLEDIEAMQQDRLRIFQPTRLRFLVEKDLKKHMDEISENYRKERENLDLKILRFADYGKGLAKKSRCSPDAWVQMAMQLAYRRDQGKFDQTYEAASLRMYLKGRTETIRTVSNESCAFVNAMENENASPADTFALLHKACEAHQLYSHDCVAGKGVDRHLFALYCVSVGKQIPSAFLNAALTPKWKLSTSQVLNRQLPARLHGSDLSLYETPNGGFGPVTDDGYGVSYCIYGEDIFYFTITTKKSCSTTSAERFAKSIEKALRDMAELAASVAKDASPGKEKKK